VRVVIGLIGLSINTEATLITPIVTQRPAMIDCKTVGR